MFRVVRVSGTIRKAEEEVIRRAKGIIRKAREVEKGRKDAIVEGVVRAVEKRGEPEGVLALVDEGEESESESD